MMKVERNEMEASRRRGNRARSEFLCRSVRAVGVVLSLLMLLLAATSFEQFEIGQLMSLVTIAVFCLIALCKKI